MSFSRSMEREEEVVMVRLRGYCGYEIMKGEFERISRGGRVLKDTTAMNAEREALRSGVEHLISLFLVEANDFQFVVENESRETKYKVDTQSMRLFGFRNDCAEDVHRADANRLGKKKKAQKLMRKNKRLRGEIKRCR